MDVSSDATQTKTPVACQLKSLIRFLDLTFCVDVTNLIVQFLRCGETHVVIEASVLVIPYCVLHICDPAAYYNGTSIVCHGIIHDDYDFREYTVSWTQGEHVLKMDKYIDRWSQQMVIYDELKMGTHSPSSFFRDMCQQKVQKLEHDTPNHDKRSLFVETQFQKLSPTTPKRKLQFDVEPKEKTTKHFIIYDQSDLGWNLRQMDPLRFKTKQTLSNTIWHVKI